MSRRFDNLVQLDHVGVSDYLQNVDFASDPLHVAFVFDLLLLENFDGNLFSSDEVSSKTHFAKRALTKGATYIQNSSESCLT